MRNMRRGIPSLFKGGTTHRSGLDEAVLKNLEACKQLTEITRTSLGPHGMNKMIVNHLDKIFVTTDTATIMQEMEIAHPAAKMIVMASEMQESEIGDGSNFVVCLSGHLLSQAEKLIKMGLHPSDIIAGYAIAGAKALQILETLVVKTVETKTMNDINVLKAAVKTAVSSKQLGYADFLSGLVANAALAVMPDNKFNFSVDNIRVAKIMGGSVQHSEVVRGMVLGRGTEGQITDLKDAKVAVFTCSLAAAETETKAAVRISTADQLLDYTLSEEKDMEAMIKAIHDSGVNCIVTGGSINDMAAHYLEKYKMMVIKVTSKFQLRRIAKMVRARALVTLGPVSPQYQGYCKHIYVREIGGGNVTVLEQDPESGSRVATILLRASTMNVLNDVERAIDDGVNTIKALGRDGRFVCGAGASDIELARQLTVHGATFPGLEQYAVKAFGKALEVVPHTLADNAGLNALNVISNMYAAHEGENPERLGLDINTGKVGDMLEAGVLDLYSAKHMAIKLATDVAITILRVDKIIQAKPAGGPSFKKQGHWDDGD